MKKLTQEIVRRTCGRDTYMDSIGLSFTVDGGLQFDLTAFNALNNTNPINSVRAVNDAVFEMRRVG